MWTTGKSLGATPTRERNAAKLVAGDQETRRRVGTMASDIRHGRTGQAPPGKANISNKSLTAIERLKCDQYDCARRVTNSWPLDRF